MNFHACAVYSTTTVTVYFRQLYEYAKQFQHFQVHQDVIQLNVNLSLIKTSAAFEHAVPAS